MTEKIAGGPVQDGRAELTVLWETARKILAQELKTGCLDRTVLGGLEKYLDRWSAAIHDLDGAYPTRPEAAQVLRLLADYAGLTSRDRAVAVQGSIVVVDHVMSRLAELPSSARRTTGTQSERTVLPRTPSAASRVSPGRPPGAGPTRTAGTVAETAQRATRPDSRPVPPPRARRPFPPVGLDDPVLTLKGVGKHRASQLAKLGIERVRDLLTHYPRDYRHFSQVKQIVELMYGETASVVGIVEDVQLFPGPRGRFRTTVKVRDASGRISATWFRYGFGGIRISPNSRVALAGTVSGHGYSISLDNPDWEPADDPPLHTRRLVPVYPLTEGVSDYWLREIMAAVVPQCAPKLNEHLPPWLLQMNGLMPLGEAVEAVHFPYGVDVLARARLRLAFDELFVVQVAALKRRAEWRSGGAAPRLEASDSSVEGFLSAQPFALTGAQRRVVSEIRDDMTSDRPMTRLLEGEVGSGKTIVAAVALLAAVLGGHQGALMAPTEILAEQHGRTLLQAFGNASSAIEALIGRPVRLAVLTSASKRPERDEIYRSAQSGELDVLVGTQALIQEGLGFRNLGLTIIDEQHRFGVMQRSALRGKGGTPHLLAMTATPIPRTLALTLYGDLDLSVIDELPPGRQKVKTYLLGPSERTHAYEHVKLAVAEGRQAFIICPLVEDSPHLEVRAATAEYERLKASDLAGLRLALLHGRMRPAEKDRIMVDFKGGEYDVLVSTSVVEVGIDVPNATVMLVEGADRFGMAQLHQFRGRVGRGAHASSCILLTDSTDEAVLTRLRTVAAVSDGFRLADEDLKLRGPGEYFGVRQSGFPDFRMADLSDLRLIEMARSAASELLRRDPDIAAPEHVGVAARVASLQKTGSS